jgi:hypothetical protein
MAGRQALMDRVALLNRPALIPNHGLPIHHPRAADVAVGERGSCLEKRSNHQIHSMMMTTE